MNAGLFRVNSICLALILVMPLIIYAQSQSDGEALENEQLELMRRQIEELQNQNELLREQIEISKQAGSEVDGQLTPNEKEIETTPSSSIVGPSPSLPVKQPKNPVKQDHGLTHAEEIALWKKAGFDYDDMALWIMFMDTLTCLDIAERNAYLAREPMLIRQSPEIYQRVMYAKQIWESALMSAKGSQLEKLEKKLDKFNQRIKQDTTFQLLAEREISSELQLELAEMLDAKLSNGKEAFRRCAETMPHTRLEAVSRFSEWRKATKAAWKGDPDAIYEVDSFYIDIMLMAREWEVEHTFESQ